MSQINVTHVYDAAGGNTATFHGVLDTPTGFRNKVRNPKMDIAQRGASFTAPASGSYTLDGWRLFYSGPVVNVAQQADVSATSECQSSLRVTVTTAHASPVAGSHMIIQQPIEGFLIRDLQGKPIAISFEVRSAKTGTHCVAIRNIGSDRSYIMPYTVNAANTWETKTLTLPAGLITAGTWNWTNGFGCSLDFTLMAGTTYQGTAGSWVTGNVFATSAQVNVMDTVGNVFAITGVQVEKGAVSSPLEHRDINTEAMFNYRYYYAPGTQYNVTGYANGANVIYHSIALPSIMRATPTISVTWSALLNATASSSRAVFGAGIESSLAIATAPNWFSGVVTYNFASAEI
jgi:hypothetical protein